MKSSEKLGLAVTWFYEKKINKTKVVKSSKTAKCVFTLKEDDEGTQGHTGTPQGHTGTDGDTGHKGTWAAPY